MEKEIIKVKFKWWLMMTSSQIRNYIAWELSFSLQIFLLSGDDVIMTNDDAIIEESYLRFGSWLDECSERWFQERFQYSRTLQTKNMTVTNQKKNQKKTNNHIWPLPDSRELSFPTRTRTLRSRLTTRSRWAEQEDRHYDDVIMSKSDVRGCYIDDVITSYLGHLQKVLRRVK